MAMDDFTFPYFPHPFSIYLNAQLAISFHYLQCLRHYTGSLAENGTSEPLVVKTFIRTTNYIKLSE